jgi:hypothetical protein
MKWHVTFECGFDENDGDYCQETGKVYHPIKGGEWVVDDTSKEDMKILALFYNAAYLVQGDEDDGTEYGDVSNEEITEKMKADKFLTGKLGITPDEIDKFMEEFDISDYFPSTHSCMAEPHDYWFSVDIEPVDRIHICNKFLSKPWDT